MKSAREPLHSAADRAQANAADLRLAGYLRGLSRLYPAALHDLRGPLNNVFLSLDLIQQSLEDEADPVKRERSARWLTTIRGELMRLYDMMERVLEHAHLTEDHIEAFDLRDLVTELETLLRSYSRSHDVQLGVSLPESPVPLEARRGALKQALLGLVLHCVDGLSKGGELHLAVGSRERAGLLTVVARTPESRPGFPPPAPSDRGDGVPVAVAREVVTSSGGLVRRLAEPVPSFEIELPLSIPRT